MRHLFLVVSLLLTPDSIYGQRYQNHALFGNFKLVRLDTHGLNHAEGLFKFLSPSKWNLNVLKVSQALIIFTIRSRFLDRPCLQFHRGFHGFSEGISKCWALLPEAPSPIQGRAWFIFRVYWGEISIFCRLFHIAGFDARCAARNQSSAEESWHPRDSGRCVGSRRQLRMEKRR